MNPELAGIGQSNHPPRLLLTSFSCIGFIVNYAAAVALEVRESASGEPVLRFNFKNGTDDDTFKTYNFLNGSGDVPLSTFVNYLSVRTSVCEGFLHVLTIFLVKALCRQHDCTMVFCLSEFARQRMWCTGPCSFTSQCCRPCPPEDQPCRCRLPWCRTYSRCCTCHVWCIGLPRSLERRQRALEADSQCGV